MQDYDFHTLNAFDFKLLIRNLLDAEERIEGIKITYKTFPARNDK